MTTKSLTITLSLVALFALVTPTAFAASEISGTFSGGSTGHEVSTTDGVIVATVDSGNGSGNGSGDSDGNGGSSGSSRRSGGGNTSILRQSQSDSLTYEPFLSASDYQPSLAYFDTNSGSSAGVDNGLNGTGGPDGTEGEIALGVPVAEAADNAPLGAAALDSVNVSNKWLLAIGTIAIIFLVSYLIYDTMSQRDKFSRDGYGQGPDDF